MTRVREVKNIDERWYSISIACQVACSLMDPTPDTPHERDQKADDLREITDAKANDLQEVTDAKAEVLATSLRRFQWEVRMYFVVLMAYIIIKTI